MADNDKPKSADDIEKELSVGNFAGQQLRTMAFTLGGVAVGTGLGFVTAKYLGVSNWLAKSNRLSKWIQKYKEAANAVEGRPEIPEQYLERLNTVIHTIATTGVTLAGSAIGLTAGSIASMYEHWVKSKREELGVQKVTNDIDLVMKSRVGFENTLNEQHKAVTALREKLEGERGKISPDKIKEEKSNSAERSVV